MARHKLLLGSLFYLLFISTPLMVNSQDDPAAAYESRTGATLAYEVNDKLELSLEQQVRLKSIGRVYDQTLSEFHASYRLLKPIKVAVGYRYISRYDDQGRKQGLRTRHRFQGRAYYQIKNKRSELNFRGQYQYRISRDPDEGTYPKEDHRVYWRFRTMYNYNIRDWKLDPELGFETFIRPLDFADGQENLYRLFLATTYRLPGPQKLKFKYFYENALSCSCLIPIHTFVINYEYAIGK